jgi:hypothetical protein
MPVHLLPPLPPTSLRRMGQLNRMLGVGFSRSPRPCKPIEHGSRYAYVRHGCRCPECAAANRSYQRANRASQPLTVPTHLHGKPSTYCFHACRCDVCRKAATEYRTRFGFRKRQIKLDWRQRRSAYLIRTGRMAEYQREFGKAA